MRQPITGSERIAAERRRQQEQEGWNSEHDAGHGLGVLTRAAIRYAMQAVPGPDWETASLEIEAMWPWSKTWLKPSEDPIRNLEKAGALIAAEIDRILAEGREVAE